MNLIMQNIFRFVQLTFCVILFSPFCDVLAQLKDEPKQSGETFEQSSDGVWTRTLGFTVVKKGNSVFGVEALFGSCFKGTIRGNGMSALEQAKFMYTIRTRKNSGDILDFEFVDLPQSYKKSLEDSGNAKNSNEGWFAGDVTRLQTTDVAEYIAFRRSQAGNSKFKKEQIFKFERCIQFMDSDSSDGKESNNKPCKDDEVEVEYDKKSKDYHRYGPIEAQICLTKNPQCNVERVFLTMISQVRFITPTENSSQVENCMETDVDIPGPFGVDHVRISVNEKNYSITNYTRKDHVLHPGKVTRTIVEKNEAIYVITEGEGTGDLKNLNSWLSDRVWKPVDNRLREAVEQWLFRKPKS